MATLRVVYIGGSQAKAPRGLDHIIHILGGVLWVS